MKILLVNKFLYPNGGSETYIFELGKAFENAGHLVEYFGMEHEGRIVGNHAESYTADMDFHSGRLSKLLYPFRIIYSLDARKKIGAVLKDFQPEVVHLNNINFQITPSVIYEIRKYEKKSGRKVKIVFTAHDYQWVCPNHMMYIPQEEEVCSRCLEGGYKNCIRHRCIHGSRLKSILGAFESWYYHKRKTYGLVDAIICPSAFLYEQLKKDPVMKEKLLVMHNFIPSQEKSGEYREKKGYVLYFGRYSREKGIKTLLSVCTSLSDIPFVFAGSGPLEEEVNQVKNIKNVGFKKGKELAQLIAEADFSIYPSEWYENCPFSVMESQWYATPVLGADMGGIPELIQNEKTGELFTGGSKEELKEKIEKLWQDKELCRKYAQGCREHQFMDAEQYCRELMKIYTA